MQPATTLLRAAGAPAGPLQRAVAAAAHWAAGCSISSSHAASSSTCSCPTCSGAGSLDHSGRSAATISFAARGFASSAAAADAADAAPSTSARPPSGREELAAFLRTHNASLPGLRGTTVLAKVLKVDRSRGVVLVDPGYHGLSEVPLASVSVSHVHGPGGVAPQRDAADDIRPGDELRLVVDTPYTPYGDMLLRPEQADPRLRVRRVWQELRELQASGRPAMGRVLNSCTGGYAVGVSGIVGLLPFGRCSAEAAARIGVLQPFRVEAVDEARGRLVLSEARLRRK